MIAGAGGLVGRHLANHSGQAYEVTALGHGDLDITDRQAVAKLVRLHRPELILNCAVIAVDECERRPDRAAAVNVKGPENLAFAASEIGAELVHFSTNYVFDGEKTSGYYTTDDEPRPVSVYGRTKLEGERAVASICGQSFIIRTSWVFGDGSTNFCSTSLRLLAEGRKVRAFADLRANATYVKDLAHRVFEITAGRRYGVYHAVNSGICSYLDVATEAASILRIPAGRARELIEPVSTGSVKLGARRPAYTPMKCKLSTEIGLGEMRGWKTGLRDYYRGVNAS